MIETGYCGVRVSWGRLKVEYRIEKRKKYRIDDY